MKKLFSLRSPSRWFFFRSDDRLLLILMGIIVGICSGLAALALSISLETLLEFFHHYRSHWWVFLLPAIGAALSSIFLNYVLKEGAGHGVPEVIYSVSRYGGLIRLRSSFSRLVSSCLTIGFGGSAGPEAPVVMSGAAIGSNIASFFHLNDRQRITLVGCGAAGAIAAIFNAPIAGMIFTMEVILGEWSMINIIPIAIASVAGAETSRLLAGNIIKFSSIPLTTNFIDFIACFGLAAVTAIISILMTRMLRNMHHVSDRIKTKPWIRAAMGGCLVGILGFFVPEVLGEGYHAIEMMVQGTFRTGLLVVAVAALAKILATSLTLGWGGSGGIFAPCLVIGSFVGIAFHRLIIVAFPEISLVNEGCFALLGMAGMISGIMQAPLTGIFLIVEITGSYEVMLPLIAVSSISTTLCHYFEPASFYVKDLVDKGQLLRPGTDERVLTDLSVAELLEFDCVVIKKSMMFREFIEVVKSSKRNYYPVENEDGSFAGIVYFDEIRPYLFDTMMYDAIIIEQIVDENVRVVNYTDDLSQVLKTMDNNNLYSMPVVSNNRFAGMISKATILDHYRKELKVQTT